MVMCYKKKSSSHSWAYKEREVKLRVLAVVKREKIVKIGRVSLPFIPPLPCLNKAFGLQFQIYAPASLHIIRIT